MPLLSFQESYSESQYQLYTSYHFPYLQLKVSFCHYFHTENLVNTNVSFTETKGIIPPQDLCRN